MRPLSVDLSEVFVERCCDVSLLSEMDVNASASERESVVLVCTVRKRCFERVVSECFAVNRDAWR
jgi:hypothetical protein